MRTAFSFKGFQFNSDTFGRILKQNMRLSRSLEDKVAFKRMGLSGGFHVNVRNWGLLNESFGVWGGVLLPKDGGLKPDAG